MNELPSDFRPDAELGATLRSALEPKDDHAAFVARVMARYDQALARAMIPTLDVLASWFRPGIAAAAAARSWRQPRRRSMLRWRRSKDPGSRRSSRRRIRLTPVWCLRPLSSNDRMRKESHAE